MSREFWPSEIQWTQQSVPLWSHANVEPQFHSGPDTLLQTSNTWYLQLGLFVACCSLLTTCYFLICCLMLVPTSYLMLVIWHLISGACHLILDTDNGESHQIKTKQAKKKLASCPELGSAQPQHVTCYLRLNIQFQKIFFLDTWTWGIYQCGPANTRFFIRSLFTRKLGWRISKNKKKGNAYEIRNIFMLKTAFWNKYDFF